MDLGTVLYTMLCGEPVGVDEFENRYYRTRRSPLWGRERRWVVYKGTPDPSTVPPEWHAWLHFTTDEPLSEAAAQAKPWQKPHQPNRTGTAEAYRPRGHQLRGGQRAPATGDYEPWRPQ